jgi:hypothetical protein
MTVPVVSSWDDPVPVVSSWDDDPAVSPQSDAAPKYLPLEERQAARARLQQRADIHARQIQQFEELLTTLPEDAQGGVRDTIAELRLQQKALNDEIERTGVGIKGRMIGSTVGSVGASLAAAIPTALVTKNPKLTAAAGVAASGLGTAAGAYLGTKYDLARAQPVTEEEATQFIKDSVIEDVIWDVGGNILLLGATGAFKMATNPALKARLMRELENVKIGKRIGIADKQRDAAAKELFNLTSRVPGAQAGEEAAAAQARVTAVEELTSRGRGALPTEGQITGQPKLAEKVARSMRADDFEAQQQALQAGARNMREELITPRGQPSREQLGLLVQKLAEAVERAVKNRTRPVFEAARRANITVDTAPIVQRIEAILQEDAGSVERLLKPTERADLQKTLNILTGGGNIGPLPGTGVPATKALSAAGAMDFISGNKAKMRAITADGVPSRYYQKVMEEINTLADDGFTTAIGGKQSALATALDAARNDYREMMGSVFDGAVQDALKRNPEDVGRLFWQNGNVTEVKQFQDLLRLGLREKTLTKDQVQSLNEAMVRGFLSDAVPDLNKAAKWSDTLKGDVKRAETYRTLLAQPGMAPLEEGMRVLEQAAKIATRSNSDMAFSGSGLISNMPARVAIGIGLGYVSLPTAAAFIGAEVWARMMATALARGDKGAFMQMQAVLRASTTGNQKALAGVRPALVNLTKWAKENGFEKDIADAEAEAEKFTEQQTTPQE